MTGLGEGEVLLFTFLFDIYLYSLISQVPFNSLVRNRVDTSGYDGEHICYNTRFDLDMLTTFPIALRALGLCISQGVFDGL